MKLKNFEILNNLNLLQNISNKRFPQRINYGIFNALNVLQKALDPYEKALKKLLDDYGARIEDNKVVLSDASKAQEFDTELQELLNLTAEIQPCGIPSEAFDYDGDKYDALTAREMLVLQSLDGTKKGA